MKIFSAIILILFLGATAALKAQTAYEYGTPNELKGLHIFFVDVGTDTASRKRILDEIERAKIKNLRLVETKNEAEIVLQLKVVSGEKVIRPATTPVYNPNEIDTLDTQTVREGAGLVLVSGKENERLLLDFADVQHSKFERHPATNFARAFLKAYKKANRTK